MILDAYFPVTFSVVFKYTSRLLSHMAQEISSLEKRDAELFVVLKGGIFTPEIDCSMCKHC